MKRNILASMLVMIWLLSISGITMAENEKGQPVLKAIETLTLDVARKVAYACEKKAKELGFSVGIVILDQAGNLKLAYLMDEQSIISLDWSKAKALTAYEFRKPANKGEFKVWNIGHETLVLGTSGGFPLKAEDKVLGAVGVSGTKTDADDEIAKAGVEEFQRLLNQ